MGIFSEMMLIKVLGGDNFIAGEGLKLKEKNTPNEINEHLKGYGEGIYFYVSI